jgi:hypothetical protein
LYGSQKPRYTPSTSPRTTTGLAKQDPWKGRRSEVFVLEALLVWRPRLLILPCSAGRFVPTFRFLPYKDQANIWEIFGEITLPRASSMSRECSHKKVHTPCAQKTSRQCGSACNFRRQVERTSNQWVKVQLVVCFLCGGKRMFSQECYPNNLICLGPDPVLPYILRTVQVGTHLKNIS